MATADTSIYSQLLRAPKSIAEYDAEARSGRMAELELANAQDARAAAQQTRARAAGLDTLLRGNAGATDLERLALLSRGGYLNEAAALRKSLDESGKTQAEVGKVKADTRGKEFETAEKAWQSNVQAVTGFKSRDDVRNHLVNLVEKAPPELQEQHVARARAMLKDLDGDPDGLEAWRERQLAGLMSAGDQMKFRRPDANALLGADTQRRGQDMTQQTAREGHQTQRRGQDLTYKAAAGANEVAREQNRTLKDIQIEKARGDVAKQQEEAGDRASAKVADAENLDNQIEVVKAARAHPGRTTVTGASGRLDPRNYIPGTNAADFGALLDQIKGTAFLAGFNSLKGGGAITEIEGKKAEQSIARLSTAQSDDAFDAALGDLLKVMESRKKRLANMPAPRAANVPRSGTQAPAAADVDPAALSDAMNKYLKPGGR